jgi:hypothetical protein
VSGRTGWSLPCGCGDRLCPQHYQAMSRDERAQARREGRAPADSPDGRRTSRPGGIGSTDEPDDTGTEDADVTANCRSIIVPTAVDAYGRRSGWVATDDREAASHWDLRLWHRSG